MMYLNGYFAILCIFHTAEVVLSQIAQCHLHTCYGCTISCTNVPREVQSNIYNKEACIGILHENTSVLSVEWSLTSYGYMCYTSTSSCVTFDSKSPYTIAYTQRCNEGCSTYYLSSIAGLMLDVTPYRTSNVLGRDGCFNKSLESDMFLFSFDSSQGVCRNFECEVGVTCFYSIFNTAVLSITRTCIIPCISPAAPMNGDVKIIPGWEQENVRYIFQTTAKFVCDYGFQLIGSSSATCAINGTWSSETPTCFSNATSSTHPTTTTSVATQANSTTTALANATNSTTTSDFTTAPSTSPVATTTEPTSTSTIATTDETSTSSVATATDPTSTQTVATTTESTSTSTVAMTTDSTSTSTVDMTTDSTSTSIDDITTDDTSTSTVAMTTHSQIKTVAPTTKQGSKIAPIYINPCLCSTKNANFNMTRHISELIEKSSIDPKETSMAKHKLTSMPDFRQSAKIIGVTGAGILCGFVAIFITCDILKLVCKCNVPRPVKKKDIKRKSPSV